MEKIEEQMARPIREFHLPRYAQLPGVGLYLDQVANYLNDCLSPLGDVKITSSMISNYVKHHLVARPVKKLYGRDQVADLMFIAVAKNVLPLDDLRIAIKIQQNSSFNVGTAYNYFCAELENTVYYVFGLQNKMTEIGSTKTVQQRMLRNLIIAVSYKAYLDKYFRLICEEG